MNNFKLETEIGESVVIKRFQNTEMIVLSVFGSGKSSAMLLCPAQLRGLGNAAIIVANEISQKHLTDAHT